MRYSDKNEMEEKILIECSKKGYKFIGWEDVNKINTQSKLILYCPEHGEWNNSRYHTLIKGHGCPTCAGHTRISEEDIIKKVNGLGYEFKGYVGGEYKNSNTKLILYCPEHGDWDTTTCSSLTNASRGCPKCGIIKRAKSKSYSKEKLESKILEICERRNYEFLKWEGKIGVKHKISVRCKKHDLIWTVCYYQFVNFNSGCPKCSYEERGEAKMKWTKETCKIEAEKCESKSKSEFQRKYLGAYKAAFKYGWLDDLIEWKELGSRIKRYIYAYEFPNIECKNFIYVGLSFDIQKRENGHHKENSTLSKFAKEHGIEIPKPIQLTDLLSVEEAIEKEGIELQKYVDKGWIPINKMKTGGIGGGVNSKLPLKVVMQRINEVCIKKGYEFRGFVDGEYTRADCKLILYCPIHGEWNTTSYISFISKEHGCRQCGNIKNRPK